MKIGLLVESGKDGADKLVCEHLIKIISPETVVSTVTHTNKPNLISQCGAATALLLEEGCDRVIIVWDLSPSHSEFAPCLHRDREDIFASLDQHKVDRAKVALVCISNELEAWFLADGQALSAFLSKPTRPVTIKGKKNPEREKSPKNALTKMMKKHGKDKYSDLTHAKQIIQHITEVKRLRACASFKRFEEKVLG